jgi:hypothetical protein
MDSLFYLSGRGYHRRENKNDRGRYHLAFRVYPIAVPTHLSHVQEKLDRTGYSGQGLHHCPGYINKPGRKNPHENNYNR